MKLAWDVAIDNNGDLIFGPNRDLASVTDMELMQQRIRIRLIMPQGTSVYDLDETVGSQIHTILRKGMTEQSYDAIVLRIQEALVSMPDVIVQDVQLSNNERDSVTATVTYSPIVDEEDVFADNTINDVVEIEF